MVPLPQPPISLRQHSQDATPGPSQVPRVLCKKRLGPSPPFQTVSPPLPQRWWLTGCQVETRICIEILCAWDEVMVGVPFRHAVSTQSPKDQRQSSVIEHVPAM